jgi:hypothetical protein
MVARKDVYDDFYLSINPFSNGLDLALDLAAPGWSRGPVCSVQGRPRSPVGAVTRQQAARFPLPDGTSGRFRSTKPKISESQPQRHMYFFVTVLTECPAAGCAIQA